MAKYLLLLITLLALSTGLFPVTAPKLMAQETGVYTISAHPDFPPIMYREGETVVGVGPELAAKIFSRLKIPIKTKYAGPWARVQNSARYGEVDCIIGIYKNKERLTYLSYVPTPFTINPCVIFVKKGNAFPFHNWNDLKGRTGGAIFGDRFRADFETFLKNNKKTVIIETVASLEQNFKKLLTNRIDFLPYSQFAGWLKIQQMGISNNIKILPTPVYKGYFYLAISKQSPLTASIPKINKLIREYKKNGTIDALTTKYFKAYMTISKNRSDNHLDSIYLNP